MRSLAAGAVLTLAALAPAAAQPPSPQAAAIQEGLDWHCAEWMKRGASDDAGPGGPDAQRAGWR